MIKLLQGDCLELLKSIPEKSIDCCLTDPPYKTSDLKWDKIIPIEPMWKQLHRLVKPEGAIVLFGNEPFSSMLRMSNLKEYRYDWIWDKVIPSGHLNAKRIPMQIYEIITVFYQRKGPYYPQMTEGKENHSRGNIDTQKRVAGASVYAGYQHRETVKTNLKYPTKLLRQQKIHPSKMVHPTEKPIPLLEYLLRTYTVEGQTVLDFTMGSGSTGVACINTGRHFIGIEKDAGYFEVAQKRIAEAEKQNGTK